MSEGERDEPERPARIGRRELMASSVAASVGVALGCGGATDAPDGGAPPGGDAGGVDAGTDAGPPPPTPPETFLESVPGFPNGVAAGDALHDRAVLWTRYIGTRALWLTVYEMDDEVYARTVFDAEVTPVEGYVHQEVQGLSGGLRYRYAFFELEGGERIARSEIGRFRAALAPEAMEPLVIGAVSCTSNGRSFDPLMHAGTRTDLDLFLLLGDTTYNDSAETLSEYRDRWAENLSTPAYRATRKATSVLATWDDHEVDNDWNPEDVDPSRLAVATHTFFEHQPLRRDTAAPERIYKSVRWGRTAELFVLDCRGERAPSEDLYVSRAQMDWLKTGLAESPAVFKIIVNSVPITEFPLVFDLAANDRWEGYPAQREEILSYIDQTPISGVLWVSGDFHLATAARVSNSGAGASQTEVLAGPGGQIGNPLAVTLTGDQFDFASTTNNYAELRLDPTAGAIEVRWIDGDGNAFETRTYAPS